MPLNRIYFDGYNLHNATMRPFNFVRLLHLMITCDCVFGPSDHVTVELANSQKHSWQTIQTSAEGFISLVFSYYRLNDGSFKMLPLRWNYGMLLIELYTGGTIPFAHVEPLHQLATLDRGERPPQPDCCPDKV